MRNPPKTKTAENNQLLRHVCSYVQFFFILHLRWWHVREWSQEPDVYDLFSFPQFMAFHHLPPCLHNLHRKNSFLKIRHPLYCILCSLRTFVFESAPSQTCYTHTVGWTLPHCLLICWILLNSNVRHPAIGGMRLHHQGWLMSHAYNLIKKIFMRLLTWLAYSLHSRIIVYCFNTKKKQMNAWYKNMNWFVVFG